MCMRAKYHAAVLVACQLRDATLGQQREGRRYEAAPAKKGWAA